MNTSTVIETVRLVLNKFGESDRDAIFGFLGDRDVMRFSLNGASTREDIQTKYLPSCQKRYARDGFGQWAIIRKSDGLCIGECGICVQEVEGKREHELSYRLRRDSWGQGFATEATRTCRDFGFNRIGLNRLISIIEVENRASIRIAEKMGMILEKKASFHRVAVLIYSVTRRTSGGL